MNLLLFSSNALVKYRKFKKLLTEFYPVDLDQNSIKNQFQNQNLNFVYF